ncbi:hypothetical protein niasHS_004963 [Heterodera schachtii]|uniref:Uncharacterized protein n=1 Tax=Heterodera schachtii TaxID=97005 RepID=A0ABD2JQM1_HETSC
MGRIKPKQYRFSRSLTMKNKQKVNFTNSGRGNELLLFVHNFCCFVHIRAVRSFRDFGRDLSSVQLLQNKQDTFNNGLNTSEPDPFANSSHATSATLGRRHIGANFAGPQCPNRTMHHQNDGSAKHNHNHYKTAYKTSGGNAAGCSFSCTFSSRRRCCRLLLLMITYTNFRFNDFKNDLKGNEVRLREMNQITDTSTLKRDVVESSIEDKEPHVRSADFGRDLSSVQPLQNKQDTFDNELNTSEPDPFANSSHATSATLGRRHIGANFAGPQCPNRTMHHQNDGSAKHNHNHYKTAYKTSGGNAAGCSFSCTFSSRRRCCRLLLLMITYTNFRFNDFKNDLKGNEVRLREMNQITDTSTLKRDVVESSIEDKEPHVRSADFGRDLSSVQPLQNKQDTFDNELNTSESFKKLKKYVRGETLNKANTVHQLLRNIDEEESWIKEKKLINSDNHHAKNIGTRTEQFVHKNGQILEF